MISVFQMVWFSKKKKKTIKVEPTESIFFFFVTRVSILLYQHKPKFETNNRAKFN